MRKADKKALRNNLVASLQFTVADCYVLQIVDSMLDEIADEIDAIGKEDYTAEDVKLALGCVMCRRLRLRDR